jgi:trigger factor
MSQLLSFKIQKNNTCLVSCLASNPDYANFKQRITDQFLKNVEVPGFRKGKAPTNLALQKVDQNLLVSTIYQESVEKFFSELEEELKQKLQQEDRTVLNNKIVLDPNSLKDNENGLEFEVIVSLLPKVDLDIISKIEITKPSKKEFPQRQTEEEFVKGQKQVIFQSLNEFEETESKVKKDSQLLVDLFEVIEDQTQTKKESKDILITLGKQEFPPEFEKELIGLKKSDKKEFELELKTEFGPKKFFYKIECKLVKYPKYKTLEELLEVSKDAQKAIPSLDSFVDSIKKVYFQESDQIAESLLRRKIIETILKEVPDFDLDEEKIESEKDRIFHNLEHQSKQEKKELIEIFKFSGLPGSDSPKLSSPEDIKKCVKDYVSKEFKLSAILQTIYLSKLENKIQEQELENISKQIKQFPESFNLTKTDISSDEKVKDIAFDRMLRKMSYDWILNNLIIKESKVENLTKK